MRRKLSYIALKIAAFYVVMGGLWILLSGWLLEYLVIDVTLRTSIEIYKGWFFVAITAWLLYILIARDTKALAASESKLIQKNEELSAAYEEVVAVEEEQRQQFETLLEKEGQIRRQNEYLNGLRETALDLMQVMDLDVLLRTIVQKALHLSGSPYGYIALLDEPDAVLEVKVVEGLPLTKTGTRYRMGEGLVGRVWETEEPMVVTDYKGWSGRLKNLEYDVLETAAGIPLKVSGQVIGVFSINYTRAHAIDAEELRMLDSFAELASIALGNTCLQKALQKIESCNRALIDALPDFIFRIGRDGVFLDCKWAMAFEMAFDPTNKIGQNISEFTQPELYARIMQAVTGAIRSRFTHQIEYEVILNGVLKYREMRIVACGDEEAVGVVRDITSRKETERRLQYLSLHDSLTSLYNRNYFEEELRRLGDNRYLPVSVIVCDIDGLKLINDTLGHSAGDQLLTAAADILKKSFRDSDVVARIGGDEFGILLANSDRGVAERACRFIREAVERYCETAQVPLSISLGIGIRIDAADAMDDAVKTADNNMYREKLHRTQSARSAIVQTLSKALEARDFVTDGHADRMQDLVEQLAKSIGLAASSLPDLRLLARFHDIGKVGIPDNILFKPGGLTSKEYENMKRHSEIGHRIALSSPELAPIADWILKHQEWWNGKGYPIGLKGEDIPIACRILAIVDAYDAMTNDRPYRQAMTTVEAVAELSRCAGGQFDPELVKSFIKVLEMGKETD